MSAVDDVECQTGGQAVFFTRHYNRRIYGFSILAAMIRAENLSFRYPGGELLQFPALDCPAGTTQLLLGASGSGKTTLLQLLAGLRRPATGEVTVQGTTLGNLSQRELDHFRGQTIGLVFQTAHFLKALTVRENLAMAMRLAGNPVNPDRIQALLTDLGIGDRLEVRPGQLSVGQQQRVAIARAVINQPAVILADEPTAALDDGNAERVIRLLQAQAAEVAAALLIVTHDNRLTRLIPQQTRL